MPEGPAASETQGRLIATRFSTAALAALAAVWADASTLLNCGGCNALLRSSKKKMKSWRHLTRPKLPIRRHSGALVPILTSLYGTHII